jgi:site-specific DNA recombinase
MIAAIYARKSTDQAEVSDREKSVNRQIEQATAYARRKGWTVDDRYVFQDDGIGGAEFAKRPGFVRLMNALKPKPGFRVLIMAEESRLGREQIETSYALKQLLQAGVRVFFYLEDRERTLGTPTDKLLQSVTAFADEIEREKARIRTYDAMARKARAGQVTGGRVFGYDNVEAVGPDGRRSHVEYRINEAEAAVVRQIFELCAAGRGQRKIAILLNDEGVVAPRAQQGRVKAWAVSTVWEVLRRPLYRGAIVWNRTRKRDQFGQRKPTARPEAEWCTVQAHALRIISEDLWQAAHARLDRARAVYGQGKGGGNPWGRPPVGAPTKYLLSGLSRCTVCGCGLQVQTRAHGSRRAFFYGCSGHRDRGDTVCRNTLLAPMARADATAIGWLSEDLERPKILEGALLEAVEACLDGSAEEARGAALRRDLAAVERELERLVTIAAAGGGEVPALVERLHQHERRRQGLVVSLEALNARVPPVRLNRRRLVDHFRAKLGEWRSLLSGETAIARQLVEYVLEDRIAFTPKQTEAGRIYEMRAHLTYDRLFTELLGSVAVGMASPAGIEPAFWP